MKTLFICQEYNLNVPRSERVRALLKIWNDDLFQVLFFDNGSTDLSADRDHVLNLSWWDKVTLFRDFSNSRSSHIFVNKLVGFFCRIYESFVKMDKWEKYQDAIIRHVLRHRFDQVVISVAPFSNLLLCWKLRHFGFEGRIFLDIGDPLANNPALNKGKIKNLASYENTGIGCSDGLIVTNHGTSNYYYNQYNYAGKIFVLPNGFWTSDYSFPARSCCEYNEIKAIYAGALYENLRPIGPLLEVVKGLSDKMNLTLISNHQRDIDVSNIRFLPRMKADQLFNYYYEANLLIYIDNKSGIQTSSKLFELLSLGKPILFLYTFESENYLFAREFSWVFMVRNEVNEIRDCILNQLYRQKLDYLPLYDQIENKTWQEVAKVYRMVLTQPNEINYNTEGYNTV